MGDMEHGDMAGFGTCPQPQSGRVMGIAEIRGKNGCGVGWGRGTDYLGQASWRIINISEQ